MNNKKKSNKKTELLNSLKNNKGRGINYILNIAYEILGNPIEMFDTSYNLLAHTENSVTDDRLWNEITEYGTFAHETVDFFNKEHFIEDVATTDVVSLLKSDKLKYDRVNSKIFDKDDIQIANICVIACYRPFENEDFKNIEIICECLSVELQCSEFYQNFERVFNETFITNLIDGKKVNKHHIENKMNTIYTSLKNYLYVAVIDIAKYDNTLTHLAYFRDLFRTLQNEFKYYIYLNNIVVIISTDNPILNIKRDLNILNEFFSKYHIYAGISSVFQNLLELQKYYKQALNALNYGMNIDIDGEMNIFQYDNFRLDYFLNSIKNDINIKSLCHPVVLLIQDYDKENNTSYFNILRTYFLLGANPDLISKTMNITNEDLLNKLQEISEIFAIDLNDGNTSLSIFISIKVLAYFSC